MTKECAYERAHDGGQYRLEQKAKRSTRAQLEGRVQELEQRLDACHDELLAALRQRPDLAFTFGEIDRLAKTIEHGLPGEPRAIATQIRTQIRAVYRQGLSIQQRHSPPATAERTTAESRGDVRAWLNVEQEQGSRWHRRESGVNEFSLTLAELMRIRNVLTAVHTDRTTVERMRAFNDGTGS